MVIEFRLYKKFDMDLIALYNMHYPVASMMREAVIAYANGRPLNYLVDEPTVFNADDCDAVHSRFNIPDSDTITCYMLSHIKFRCKNAFVKTVLRNALIQQNLTCFFTDNALNQTHFHNASAKNVQMLPNVIRCSQIKELDKHIRRKKRKSVADGNAVYSNSYKKQKRGTTNAIAPNNYNIYNSYSDIPGMTPPPMAYDNGQQVSQIQSLHPNMQNISPVQNMYDTGMPNAPIVPDVPDGPPPVFTAHPHFDAVAPAFPYGDYYNENGMSQNEHSSQMGQDTMMRQAPYHASQVVQSPIPRPQVAAVAPAQYQQPAEQNEQNYARQAQDYLAQDIQNTMTPASHMPQMASIPRQQTQMPQMDYRQQAEQSSANYNYNISSDMNTPPTTYDEESVENDNYKTENAPEIQLAGNADLLSIFDNL